jgi:hypothetical protein
MRLAILTDVFINRHKLTVLPGFRVEILPLVARRSYHTANQILSPPVGSNLIDYGESAIKDKSQSRPMDDPIIAIRVRDFAKNDISKAARPTTAPDSILVMVVSGRPGPPR